MSAITTHVLDTSVGRPAAGVAVSIEWWSQEDGWLSIGGGTTDDDGRVGNLLAREVNLSPGLYRITFNTGDYYARTDTPTFYPSVTVLFEIRDVAQHYHVPLLLNPFGYSTYRGS